MKVVLTIAWRNIGRHPARSGVLLAAIVVGLWAGTVSTGAINALMQQRMTYLIESEIAHVQVHHPRFLQEFRVGDSLPEYQAIETWLANDERVRAFAARAIAEGMLQSPVRVSGANIRGVDPEAERRTTTFHETITEGEYLDADVRQSAIVGEQLASDHNIEIGDRVVLTFENAESELTAAAFHVTGFFESASTEYDRRTVLVRAGDLAKLLSDEPIRHEIAILLEDEGQAAAVAADLNEAFPDVLARTWRELSPELNMLVEMGDVMLFIVILIIMAALAFGILNTMLMALFERMREIGMLMAIGMSRRRVFGMILLESTLLTALGAVAGMVLAWGTIRHLGKAGLHLDRFAAGAASLGWDSTIYPFLTTAEYASILAVVIAITLLASCYPAWKAIRIRPLEAGRDL